jgi:uncharacterized protein
MGVTAPGHGRLWLMASLKDLIKSDLTHAMRARDDVRKSTLRMVLSAIGTAEVAGPSAK